MYAQYTTTIVTDNWGSHFDARISDIEHRMVDLELVRVTEICLEHDDRVAALEAAVVELKFWRPKVDGNINDICVELRRVTNPIENLPQHIGPSANLESTAACPLAGTPANWPAGIASQR